MREATNWTVDVLANLAHQVDYGLTASAEGRGDGPKFLRITDIQDGSVDWATVPSCHCSAVDQEKYRLHRDDVVFVRTGATTGKSYLIVDCPIDTVFASYLIRVRPNNRVLSSYLAYFFQTTDYWDQVNRSSSGSAQPGVNATKLKNLRIPLPLLSEQQRIVAILDEAFAGIAVAVVNAEKNLANARELFECHLNAVFSQKGEGWVETTLGEVCRLKSGTTVAKSLERSFGDVPYLKVADMTLTGNEAEIVRSSRYLSRSDVRESAIFPEGTVIFPKRGGAIATNKKRLTSVPICTDLNIMGLTPSSVLTPRFLYFYSMNVDMAELGSGSSIPQINNYDIEPLVIAFPESIKVQVDITTKLSEILAESQRLESIYLQKLESLAELKQSILQKAFAGELTAEPDRILAEAGKGN